jgi:hypothetical protein
LFKSKKQVTNCERRKKSQNENECDLVKRNEVLTLGNSSSLEHIDRTVLIRRFERKVCRQWKLENVSDGYSSCSVRVGFELGYHSDGIVAL